MRMSHNMTVSPAIPLRPQDARRAGLLRLVASALGVGALLVAALSAPLATADEGAKLDAAAACQPVVAILPAFHQWRDMAQGFEDGPLADRDSSGLSRAELWQEIPVTGNIVQLVNVLPLPEPDGREVAARISGINNGSPVISTPFDPDDAGQMWFRQTINGFTTYTSVLISAGGKRITYKPGDPTAPFRLQTPGAEGQLFKVKFNGCL